MNSKKTIGWVKKLVAAAGASLLLASLAGAQDFQGKFTLDNQAQWGQLVLEPSSYTLTLKRLQAGERIIEVRSDANSKSAAMILPASYETSAVAPKSSLVCIRQGGRLIVSALEAGPMGERIYFHVPKDAILSAKRRNGKQPKLLAQAPVLIQRVAVE